MDFTIDLVWSKQWGGGGGSSYGKSKSLFAQSADKQNMDFLVYNNNNNNELYWVNSER
jgi:hypothetical protein